MPKERRCPPCKLAINFAMSFLADLGGDRAAWRGHQETARFSGQPDTPTALDPALRQGRHPSQIACVEILDLASVSLNLRPVSNSARRMPPIVSANLRRKLPLIARLPHFDCAPLQVTIIFTFSHVFGAATSTALRTCQPTPRPWPRYRQGLPIPRPVGGMAFMARRQPSEGQQS